jgi:hypothetical protein
VRIPLPKRWTDRSLICLLILFALAVDLKFLDDNTRVQLMVAALLGLWSVIAFWIKKVEVQFKSFWSTRRNEDKKENRGTLTN